MKVLRNVSPESFSAEQQQAHTEENLVKQSHPALPNLKNIQGKGIFKLTLIITSQRKIIK